MRGRVRLFTLGTLLVLSTLAFATASYAVASACTSFVWEYKGVKCKTEWCVIMWDDGTSSSITHHTCDQ